MMKNISYSAEFGYFILPTDFQSQQESNGFEELFVVILRVSCTLPRGKIWWRRQIKLCYYIEKLISLPSKIINQALRYIFQGLVYIFQGWKCMSQGLVCSFCRCVGNFLFIPKELFVHTSAISSVLYTELR